MDALIDFLGRDTFMALVVFVGCVVRASQGEKVPVVQGLISAFTPFFVIVCLLYLLEWGVGQFGLALPPKVFGALGGLFGYLANSWLAGLQKDGAAIAENGAASSLIAIAKSIVNFKKTP
ncbi:hypothetical protein [Spirosoma sp. KNUC1025]|uniref:hypothetical protein n=1 Tax=Spirosoma sp. KNUC1025 TaxID=2894082 RepID=UPI0038646E40|nr:hypothetical protein LN737_19145 [Spirosoma sp. KNUC1025]